jgi:putative inorganic carbon (HCO3(-)) transporter
VTLLPAAAACVALALAYRPAISHAFDQRKSDIWLLAVLCAAFVQLIPMPRTAVVRISPAADRITQAMSLVPSTDPIPLSVHPWATSLALAIAIGCVILFFSVRRLFGTDGSVRMVIRTIATTGLLLAAVAVAQQATGRGTLYWTWRMTDEGATPFGPFVNRNHFATWAIMAVPFCVGYLIAHVAAHRRPSDGTPLGPRIASILDARVLLLFASATALTAAVVVSLSRSGMAGLTVAAACGWLLARRRANPPSRARMVSLALVCVVGAAVVLQVDPAALTGRLAESGVAMSDRLTIWQDTLPVISDSWLTGTGLGTFQTAMLVYQRSRLEVLFNQAHNHYLQVATEGGLLVGVPVLLSLAGFTRVAARRLREDHSGMYWIRGGAAAGLAGVAVQSLWEVGLTTPANAAMAVVLAAALVHTPLQSETARSG